ncbi:MAG: hypothetical protein RLZZ70_352 [Candidatus Parcubacteria bacterium]
MQNTTRRKLKVYVGMALTDAPPEFREVFQAQVKGGLKALGDVVILDFVGLEKGTATDVYRYDRSCTEEADLCCFIVDHASTGLGMEIMLREQCGKPALFFAASGKKVTRMLTGFLDVGGRQLLRYESAGDVISAVSAWIFEQRD